MCTLSYLPLENGYFVVNNRDESPLRGQAHEPQIFALNGRQVLAPIDSEGLGTWIGVNDSGKLACLMNGAFEVHIKQSHYRKSRGKITLEFLQANDDLNYFDELDLDNIEPFTLILIDNSNIKVLRWDAVDKHIEILSNDKAYNWSSATLYDSKTISERRTFFDQYNSTFAEQKEKLVAWHKDEIINSPSILLKRPEVASISITTISKGHEGFELNYEDLLLNKIFNSSLDIIPQAPPVHNQTHNIW